MITIFTNPRPFVGPFDTIQRNAIKSWTKLSPKCEIVLFEDEEGTTSKVAAEFGLHCVSGVKCDEFGTPLLDSVFGKVKEIAGSGIIVQVNADIILMGNFSREIERVSELLKGKPFFMSGRRWNIDLEGAVNFEESDWEEKLKKLIKEKGKLHRPSGMDYWILPLNFPFDIPSFVIGRPGMDSWLVYRSRRAGIPVIDSTAVIEIIHQNHNYPKKKNPYFETEVKRNIETAGGLAHMGTLRDANWLLTKKGLGKPPFPRRIYSLLTLFYPWQILLSLKRKLQKRFK